MSGDLDALALSLQAGFLPTEWRALSPPSLKPLGSWLSHLMRRIDQYTAWIAQARVISLFVFPTQGKRKPNKQTARPVACIA